MTDGRTSVFSFGRYVDDLVTVFRWNPRLYRVVLTGGVVLGFLLGVYVTLALAFLGWALTR
jgi:hypothetical protein